MGPRVPGVLPRHGRLLEERCGCASRTPSSWRDHRVGACRAGDDAEDPRLAAVVPASAAILAVYAYLLARLDAGAALPLPLLDLLPLYEALDVLERVRALSNGGYSERWHNATTLRCTWSDLLAEGYAVLSGGSLPEALDRAFEGGAATGAVPTLTAAYGWFHRWLDGTGGRAFPGELLRSVLDRTGGGSGPTSAPGPPYRRLRLRASVPRRAERRSQTLHEPGGIPRQPRPKNTRRRAGV